MSFYTTGEKFHHLQEVDIEDKLKDYIGQTVTVRLSKLSAYIHKTKSKVDDYVVDICFEIDRRSSELIRKIRVVILNLPKSTTFTTHVTLLESRNPGFEIVKTVVKNNFNDCKLWEGTRLSFKIMHNNYMEWEVTLNKGYNKVLIYIKFPENILNTPPYVYINSNASNNMYKKWIKGSHGH